ncbi:hypothetical protein [Massilia horti]|uniref:Transmembrane protein n=1 Tax=Massilia horti TaxID=2562153 RepID=A0A4Y9T1P6_9BURK|nr:hypothetical protein [Massilia horti]TFW31508.1 hypothetical protein E4O92_13690 [Massilia horti]
MGPARLPAFAAALVLAAAPLCAGAAGKQDNVYRFGIIGHSFAGGGEAQLKQAIQDTGENQLAFVVVTGIKGTQESCTDKLYLKRRDLIAEAKKPMIVAPAGSDWTECKNSAGRSNAIERLNRLRELFYGEPASLGSKKLPLTRQSMSPRFRSYAENAHWEVGKVLYATLNLPANNNHYLQAAGRNSEYEDRLVANRFWLHRLFAIAKRDKVDALVLFSEGDLKPFSEPTGLRALLGRSAAGHDGFAEPRRQVLALAQKFSGKVLLVDSAALPKGARPAIEWRGNLGHLTVGANAFEISVDPDAKAMFTLKEATD